MEPPEQQMVEQIVTGFTLMDMLMIGAGFASLVGWFTRLEVRSQSNKERLVETKKTMKHIYERLDKLSESGTDRRDKRRE